MRVGLIAEKVGMTQYFDDNGVLKAITILKVDPCTVVALRTKNHDGVESVQLGTKIEENGKHINKAQLGFFKKHNLSNFRILKDFRVDDSSAYKVGDIITVEHFKQGDLIDVTGITKGKGFAGGMKRYGFGGLRATHGVSVSHRSHGSTGNRTEPGRVFKGKRMAGHMGNTRVTVLNLPVTLISAEKGLIYVNGAVPGGKNGIVYIRDAIRQENKKVG
ncbi:MAG: 50S ribosomal protein L3 [Alphaproteobacteria bacterium]|nr:50S ribosomal protein L3 [Alphaproteobacteria bacterium]